MANLSTVVTAFKNHPTKKAITMIGRWRRDRTSPVITITSPTSESTYENNTAAINLSGTASDNYEVKAVTWINQTTSQSGTATGTTSWSITGINLVTGNNVIVVTATDGNSNIGTDTITVDADIANPTITITSPTSDITYDTETSTVTLSGTASDDVAVTSVTWANAATGGSGSATGTSSWSISDISLNDGANAITVTAHDARSKIGTDLLTVNYSVPIPVGAIIPFNSTSIPSGWTRFTSADDKFIVGAGSSYAVGATGGSYGFSLSSATTSSGTHSSNSGSYWIQGNVSTASGQYPSNWLQSGSHNHPITGNYTPAYNQLCLIKSTQAQSSFPENSIALSHGSMDTTGFSNVYNNNRLLRSGASITTSAESKTLSFASSGSHYHPTQHLYTFGTPYSFPAYLTQSAGNHTHGDVTPTVTEYIKKVQLSLWTKASASFTIKSNMIVMWESMTPPDGWYICNGSNGTPDLRDYFIYSVTDGSESSGSGNNTINVQHSAGTDTNSWLHSHQGSQYNSVPTAYPGWHMTNQSGLSHSHTTSIDESPSLIPPYYSLAFIMKS